MSYFEQLDIKLFFLINSGMQNGFFDILMPFVTNFKNWWPVISLAVIWLLGWGGKKGRVVVILMIAGVAISDYSTGKIIKEIVARLRPCKALEGVHLLAYCGKYGFPSSHASNTAVLAVIGGCYYRKAMIPLLILAIVIGYSRVYVGVHYPFDVLGGYVWGGLIAWVTIGLEKKVVHVGKPGHPEVEEK